MVILYGITSATKYNWMDKCTFAWNYTWFTSTISPKSECSLLWLWSHWPATDISSCRAPFRFSASEAFCQQCWGNKLTFLIMFFLFSFDVSIRRVVRVRSVQPKGKTDVHNVLSTKWCVSLVILKSYSFRPGTKSKRSLNWIRSNNKTKNDRKICPIKTRWRRRPVVGGDSRVDTDADSKINIFRVPFKWLLPSNALHNIMCRFFNLSSPHR